MIKKVIIILLFSAIPSVSAWANNFEQKNIAEIKNILRKAEPDYFPANVKIKSFGEVATFKIYITELIWENLRETKRLVLLSRDNKYLGNYGLDTLPQKIKNNKIIFDVAPESGNEIDLSKGIPEEIYIDGQTILFEKANSSENFKKRSGRRVKDNEITLNFSTGLFLGEVKIDEQKERFISILRSAHCRDLLRSRKQF